MMDNIPEEITVMVDRYADTYGDDQDVLMEFVANLLHTYDELIHEGLVH